MSKKARDDAPPEPDEGGEDVEALDPASQAIEDEAEEFDEIDAAFEHYGYQTDRLNAYAEVLRVLYSARGFPVNGGGDMALQASNQENLDGKMKSAARNTAIAILRDVERIANDADAEPKGEGI